MTDFEVTDNPAIPPSSNNPIINRLSEAIELIGTWPDMTSENGNPYNLLDGMDRLKDTIQETGEAITLAIQDLAAAIREVTR